LIYLLRRTILSHLRFRVTLRKKSKHPRVAVQQRGITLSQVWRGFRKMKSRIATWEMKHFRDSLPNRVHLVLRILFSSHAQITSRTYWNQFITLRIYKANGNFSLIWMKSRSLSHNQLKQLNSYLTQLISETFKIRYLRLVLDHSELQLLNS